MRTHILLGLAIALGAAGCASDGNETPDPDAAPVVPGTVEWTEGGIVHSDLSAFGGRQKYPSYDLLAVSGTISLDEGVSFFIIDLTPEKPAPLNGVYNCSDEGHLQVTLTSMKSETYPSMSCSITVKSAGAVGGARATGSFEGVLSDGTVVTDGIFDVPVYDVPSL